MKPIHFKEANVVFAKDQPEYQQLPAHRNTGPQGEVISCWHLSFRERMRLLLTGRVWVCLLTFNAMLTPSYLTTKKGDLLNGE